MRRILAVAALAALSTSPVSAQNIVQQHGRLQVQGNRIIDEHGIQVTLRGMALYWSQWKPAFYNPDCVRWLRDDWKCTVVRPSMAVTQGGYLSNPAAETGKVKAVIQAAIDQGLYVIVDFHEIENGMDHLSQAKAFFGEISKTYGKYPNLIYETWNEPLDTHDWAKTVKPYHEAVIQVIRANDPDNIILCGTPTWSQDVDKAAVDPITSSTNIAYTLHFYAATHKAALRSKAAAALSRGIALMVTEGGLSEANGGGAIDTAEALRWLDFLDKNGIAWMNWSIADLGESSAALRPGSSAAGGWAPAQLSPSGAWVRNRLRARDGPITAIAPAGKAESGGDRGGSSLGRNAVGNHFDWIPDGASAPGARVVRDALGRRLTVTPLLWEP